MLNRRYFFKAGVACGALTMAGARARLAFAALPDDRRFVVVILRGALDGLAAVPAHGDPDYSAVRGNLALPANGPGAPIDLDGFFGLHPSLHNLADLFHANELAIFHNASTPYRDRSHFEAQNVLETGATTPHLLNDGWLNRALAPLALDTGTGALAVSSSPPLLLDGPARVTSWLPSRRPVPDEEFRRASAHSTRMTQCCGMALTRHCRPAPPARALCTVLARNRHWQRVTLLQGELLHLRKAQAKSSRRAAVHG
jgi:uncharacterized protein (DUF1501 family)